VGEDREQPALRIRLPAVNDREQGDLARDRFRLVARLGLQRLQLASRGTVDDVPPTGAQLVANCVGLFEIALPAAPDALVEKTLGCVLVEKSPCARPAIRAFWL
jgi:hypothetical protein